MTITPADEALVRDLAAVCIDENTNTFDKAKAAQLIAAHVAAQAPSGLVEIVRTTARQLWDWKARMIADGTRYITADELMECLDKKGYELFDALAAHKARQPVADVRGMVEAAQSALKHFKAFPGLNSDTEDVIKWMHWIPETCRRLEAALASARHAMGGVSKKFTAEETAGAVLEAHSKGKEGGWLPVDKFDGADFTDWHVLVEYEGQQRQFVCRWLGGLGGWSIPGLSGLKAIAFRPLPLPPSAAEVK